MDRPCQRCAKVRPSWYYLGKQHDDRSHCFATLSYPSEYASRVSVSAFSTVPGRLLTHMMFDGLQLPRLEANVEDGDNDEPEDLSLSKYFQLTLKSLSPVDRAINFDPNWLTASSSMDLARDCPSLKRLSLPVSEVRMTPSDLACFFFRNIRSDKVRLDLGKPLEKMLRLIVLSALTNGGCLEVLVIRYNGEDSIRIEAARLERLCESTRVLFPNLEVAELDLFAQAVPWEGCTTLRVSSHSSRDKPSILNIAKTSQLRVLEIMGHRDNRDPDSSVLARSMFFPHANDTSEADAEALFSRLTALENLSISIWSQTFPDYLLQSMSHCCESHGSMVFQGWVTLRYLSGQNAPLFRNFKQVSKSSFSAYHLRRLCWVFQLANISLSVGIMTIILYTPVSNDHDLGRLELLIRLYLDGQLSRYLGKVQVGDDVEVRGSKGGMRYWKGMSEYPGMVSGGTEITPLYERFRAICENKTDDTEISLLYANRSEPDVMMRQQLKTFAKQSNGRLRLGGGRGHVNREVLQKWMPTVAADTKILLCGPPPMVDAVKNSCSLFCW
ncbi:hypothetical protein D6D01_10064 [Aureobasidium pullulans]|uniref:FAD-binding FR-type domain-containing protein n=1 Tax=Aureobasidium pullulans TaxID=5580 RepID=A0A4S9JQ19_AURPU|nr:hypothetical protein D6D01_10064 [Aureobasidium pullulans]